MSIDSTSDRALISSGGLTRTFLDTAVLGHGPGEITNEFSSAAFCPLHKISHLTLDIIIALIIILPLVVESICANMAGVCHLIQN